MASNASTLASLARARCRGQKPEHGIVVVGDIEAAAWASRNRFAFVASADLTDDPVAFAGLYVIVRMARPERLLAVWQQLALTAAFVTLFDLVTRRCEYLRA